MCVFFLLYDETVARKHDGTSFSGLPTSPRASEKVWMGCVCHFPSTLNPLYPHFLCDSPTSHTFPGKQVSLMIVLKLTPWYCIKEAAYGWSFIKMPSPKSRALPHLGFPSYRHPEADEARRALRGCSGRFQSLLRN